MWGNAVIAQLLAALGQGQQQMPQQMQPRSQQMAGRFQRNQMPGSAGLFDQYMQNGMMPRYQPPSIPGVFGMQSGGYRGFSSPQMPKLTQAQAPLAGLGSGPQGPAQGGLTWDQYFGRGDAAGP